MNKLITMKMKIIKLIIKKINILKKKSNINSNNNINNNNRINIKGLMVKINPIII
jgi:hypothetical protein